MKRGPSTTQQERQSLGQIRREIDALDERILNLLNDRAQAAVRIGKLKEELALEYYAPEREREIYERLETLNRSRHGMFPAPAIQRVYREIISASLSLEKPLRVAYLGPRATFTHVAAIEHFGMSAQTNPVRGVADVFAEVENGRADYGVVPVENSTEGIVSHTLDLLSDSPLKIMGEALLEIEHHLLTRKIMPLASIKTVISHPQALAQCRGWLDKNLPGIPRLEADSTAQASQRASEDEQTAAIASRAAGDLYGLVVAHERIQDQADNYTRFLILGHETVPATGQDKTSIVFAAHDKPGALFKTLKPFADAGINMTKIESRPRKTRPWEYVFFVDLSGHVSDVRVAKALKQLERTCAFVKVLGSYPAAGSVKTKSSASRKPRRKGKR